MDASAANMPDTARRILLAAGEIFAAKGFSGATVREICDAAGANVSAVSYYFDDKAGLYRSVLEMAFDDKLQPTKALEAEVWPEERLEDFVASLLRGWSAAGFPWRDKLLYREMLEPTEAMAQVIEHSLRPTSVMLRRIVGELLGLPAEQHADPVVVRCATSVIGQCSHYHFAGNVQAMLYPELPRGVAAIEELTAHITRFSLAGIRAVRQHREAQKPR